MSCVREVSSKKGTWRLVRVDSKMNGTIYCNILGTNLLSVVRELKINMAGFQYNHPKHTARKTKEWLCKKLIKVLEWLVSIPYHTILSTRSKLWRELKLCVAKRLPQYHILEKICAEGWAKIPTKGVCRPGLCHCQPRLHYNIIKYQSNLCWMPNTYKCPIFSKKIKLN